MGVWALDALIMMVLELSETHETLPSAKISQDIVGMVDKLWSNPSLILMPSQSQAKNYSCFCTRACPCIFYR